MATGTGSGKTECFLYPILDHVLANPAQRGIKAILLYPMNALAGDQARRFAKLDVRCNRLWMHRLMHCTYGGPQKGMQVAI